MPVPEGWFLRKLGSEENFVDNFVDNLWISRFLYRFS